MDPEFWLMKWHNNETGFHEQEANPNLTQNIHRLSLAPGSRIFVPLCGKTLDIPWLIKQGYYVVAAELSTIAIAQLCQQLDIIPDSTKIIIQEKLNFISPLFFPKNTMRTAATPNLLTLHLFVENTTGHHPQTPKRHSALLRSYPSLKRISNKRSVVVKNTV